jgi:hypothetical protein
MIDTIRLAERLQTKARDYKALYEEHGDVAAKIVALALYELADALLGDEDEEAA